MHGRVSLASARACDCSAGKDSGRSYVWFGMRIRRLGLFAMCALLGAAVAVLPAFAGSEAGPTIEAFNSIGIYKEQRHYWVPSTVSISPGGIVTLSNPTAVEHGVEWVGGPATPACEGVPVNAKGAAWKGTCTFAKAGTYIFYCTVHGVEMTGEVKVGAGETTTTATTTTPSTTIATTTTPAAQLGAGTQPGGPTPTPTPRSLANALRGLELGQRGAAVRGRIEVSSAQAGGRLEVDLLARGAALARSGGAREVRVGRLVRSELRAGSARFSVALDARAIRALARSRRLTVTVTIILAPLHGPLARLSRKVLLRA
jgi:plastocyanin